MEVTKALIKLQEPFFRYGPRYTKLLPIQELAQALSMPEELVSATLKNKYLQSPFGVYPMKYFLAREHHPQQEGRRPSASSWRSLSAVSTRTSPTPTNSWPS